VALCYSIRGRFTEVRFIYVKKNIFIFKNVCMIGFYFKISLKSAIIFIEKNHTANKLKPCKKQGIQSCALGKKLRWIRHFNEVD